MSQQISRAEFDRLQEDHDYVRGRVIVHDAMLTTMANSLSQIETDLHELREWKDDSKIQEIAVLKGKLRKNDKLKDRVIYALLMGFTLEMIRIGVAHFPWFQK